MSTVLAGKAGVPVLLLAANQSPVPSSLMVPVPTAAAPPVLVAVRVKVWLLSAAVSLTMAVRTSRLLAPVGTATKLLAV